MRVSSIKRQYNSSIKGILTDDGPHCDPMFKQSGLEVTISQESWVRSVIIKHLILVLTKIIE